MASSLHRADAEDAEDAATPNAGRAAERVFALRPMHARFSHARFSHARLSHARLSHARLSHVGTKGCVRTLTPNER